MRTVEEILEELKPGLDYTDCDTMVDSQLLDSLDVISLVSELTDEYDIEISYDEITPENFNSVEAIKALVDSLM